MTLARCKEMAVKFIRIFLAAVVLVMSVANVLFIVENWKINVAEKTVESRMAKKEETRIFMPLNETSPTNLPLVEGE